MKTTNVKEIAVRISELIDRKASDMTYEDRKWKEYYDSIIHNLNDEINQCKQLIQDYSDENLTINRIESEGYYS